MELKRVSNFTAKAGCLLLIVPYGIETMQGATMQPADLLLIIPYGIETR